MNSKEEDMYLVVGATGRLGGAVAKRLLEAGEEVRVLVRSESPVRAHLPHTDPDELRAAGANVVGGDLTDPSGFRHVLEDVRVVISTASGTKRAPPDTTDAVDATGNARLAEAAAQAGVDRYVLVSALGATSDPRAGLFYDKWRAEEGVKRAGVPYAFVRPARLMTDWIGTFIGAQVAGGGNVVELKSDPDRPMVFVDEPDVTALVVAVSRDGETRHSTTTDAVAESASYGDIVRRLSQRVGRDLEVRRLSMGEAASTVGPELRELMTSLLTIDALAPAMADVDRSAAERYGVPLTGIDSFLDRMVGRPG